MLQFITAISEKFPVIEQAELSIKGGCQWIHLSDKSKSEIGTDIDTLVNLCRDNETFLIIEDDVDLAEDLKVHGVLLRDNSREKISEVRNRLGAEAIIGTSATKAGEILLLKGLDIDYVAVKAPGKFETDDETVEFFLNLFNQVRQAGIDFHLVAECDASADVLCKLIKAGYAGVAASKLILDADEPDIQTASIIERLTSARSNQ